jgi:hypothetical protein
MRSLFLFIACVYSLTSNCQIITFKDPNFESALVNHIPKIDTNSDDKIQVNEAMGVSELKINGKNISSIDEIRYFKNLKKVNCNDNQIKTISISNLDQLEEIYCRTNGLEQLSLKNLKNLKSLICGSNNLISLKIKKCASIREIYCLDNMLSYIKLNAFKELENLVAEGNKLKQINISPCKKLKQVHLQRNNLITLDISKNLNLKFLYIDNNVNLIMTTEQEKSNPPIRLTPPPPAF